MAQDGPGWPRMAQAPASCTFKQLALICWKRLGVNGNLSDGLKPNGGTMMNSQSMAKIWKNMEKSKMGVNNIPNSQRIDVTWIGGSVFCFVSWDVT